MTSNDATNRLRALLQTLPPPQSAALKENRDLFTLHDWQLCLQDERYLKVMVAIAQLQY